MDPHSRPSCPSLFAYIHTSNQPRGERGGDSTNTMFITLRFPTSAYVRFVEGYCLLLYRMKVSQVPDVLASFQVADVLPPTKKRREVDPLSRINLFMIFKELASCGTFAEKKKPGQAPLRSQKNQHIQNQSIELPPTIPSSRSTAQEPRSSGRGDGILLVPGGLWCLRIQLQPGGPGGDVRRAVLPQVQHWVHRCGSSGRGSGVHSHSCGVDPHHHFGGVGLVQPEKIDQEALALLQSLARVSVFAR